MPKSLGQIHTVNYGFTVAPADVPGAIINVDLPGQLTNQLNRMVRQGNYFKCVGIDMGMTTTGTVGGGQVSGYLRYFAPTQGRCAAYRGAFDSMREQMKIQGISMADNKLYDFKVGFNDLTPAVGNAMDNNATLDGTNSLTLVNTTVGRSVFGIHNRSVEPVFTGTADAQFQAGFDTVLSSSAALDFVNDETVAYRGSPDSASELWESIPFMMSWTPDTTDLAIQFQWRPDPALYLAIMNGTIQLYIEELNLDGGAPSVELTVAVHVSGWKSIMGNPNKKRKRKSSKKKIDVQRMTDKQFAAYMRRRN